jgi:hypothetical protein
MHEEAKQAWREAEDAGTVTGVVDGVEVVLKYEGSNRSTDYRSVIIDGVLVGREAETIPWSVFKPISVTYYYYMARPLRKAEAFIRGVPGSFGLAEEWYPADDGIVRYNARCGTLEELVALWKKEHNKQ